MRVISKPATRLHRGWLLCKSCGKVIRELPIVKTIEEEVSQVMQHMMDVRTERFDSYNLRILKQLLEELDGLYAEKNDDSKDTAPSGDENT